MPLSDKEKEMLDKLGGLLSGLLESGKGSVSDKEMGLLSVVPPENQAAYETLNAPKQAEMEAKRRSTLNSLGVDAINQTSQGAISEREIQHFMSTQSHPVQTRLNEIRGAVSDVEFQMFMRQYMAGQIPEGALFEPLPNTQQGANLGFTAPQMAGLGDKPHSWADDPFGGYYDEFEGWPRRPDVGGFGTYEERFKQHGGQGGWYPTKKRSYQYPSPRTLDFT